MHYLRAFFANFLGIKRHCFLQKYAAYFPVYFSLFHPFNQCSQLTGNNVFPKLAMTGFELCIPGITDYSANCATVLTKLLYLMSKLF